MKGDLIAQSEVLRLLGGREGMVDDRYFVGRQATRFNVKGCFGPGACNAAWVSGVQRIGKSSLVRLLSRQGSSIPIWVDAGDVSATDFTALVTRVVERAAREVPLSGESPHARLESLALASRTRPVTIVFDEFDAIAPNLTVFEQAFLRRLKSENPQFGYVFITRIEPKRTVEEVEDKSRLLGICTQVRLPALEAQDVQELCELVADDLRQPIVAASHALIWRLVGGHTIAVRILLQAVAIAAIQRDLQEEILPAVLAVQRPDAEPELRVLWRQLMPATRQAMLDEANDPLREFGWTSAMRDGYSDSARRVIKPEWLLAIGRQLGATPPSNGTAEAVRLSEVERLHGLIYTTNANLEKLGYVAAFLPTTEILQYHYLLRGNLREDGLGAAVNHLYKILYEGARQFRRSEASAAGEWRMPPALAVMFRKSEGMQQLVALRNFLKHDPAAPADPDAPNWRYRNAGDVYERHSGTRTPRHPDEWKRIIAGLVADLNASLDTVEQETRALPACS